MLVRIVRLLAAVGLIVASLGSASADVITVPRFQAGSFPDHPEAFAVYDKLSRVIARFPESVTVDPNTVNDIAHALSALGRKEAATAALAPLSLNAANASYEGVEAQAVEHLSEPQRSALETLAPSILKEAEFKIMAAEAVAAELSAAATLRYSLRQAEQAARLLFPQATGTIATSLAALDRALFDLGSAQVQSLMQLRMRITKELDLLQALDLDVASIRERSDLVPVPVTVNVSTSTITLFRDATGEMSLAAELSQRVYSDELGDQNVLTMKVGQDGFKGVAYQLPDGRLAIAFAGTDPLDSSDLAADLELAIDYLASRQKVAGLATDKAMPVRSSKLDSQILQAKRFFVEAQAEYLRTNKTTPKSILVVGHSLGGLLAQIVGAINLVKTRTFAAPGVPSLTARRHGVVVRSSVDIVNVGRRADLVHSFGTHLGQTLTVSDANLSASAKLTLDSLASPQITAAYNAYLQHEIGGLAGELKGNPSGIITTDQGAEELRADAAVATSDGENAVSQVSDVNGETAGGLQTSIGGEGDTRTEQAKATDSDDASLNESTAGDASASLQSESERFTTVGTLQSPSGTYLLVRDNEADALLKEDMETGERTPLTPSEEKAFTSGESDPALSEGENEKDATAPEEDSPVDGTTPSGDEESYKPHPDEPPPCEAECEVMLDRLVSIISQFQTQSVEPEPPATACERDPACDPYEFSDKVAAVSFNAVGVGYDCWSNPACDPPEDFGDGANASRPIVTPQVALGDSCEADPACDPPETPSFLVHLEEIPPVASFSVPRIDVRPASYPSTGIVGRRPLTRINPIPPSDDQSGQSAVSDFGAMGGVEYSYACMDLQIRDEKAYSECRELVCEADYMLLTLGQVKVRETRANSDIVYNRQFGREELHEFLVYAGFVDARDRSELIASLLLSLFYERPYNECLHGRLMHAAVLAYHQFRMAPCLAAFDQVQLSAVRLDLPAHWLVGSQSDVIDTLKAREVPWSMVARLFDFTGECYGSAAMEHYRRIFPEWVD